MSIWSAVASNGWHVGLRSLRPIYRRQETTTKRKSAVPLLTAQSGHWPEDVLVAVGRLKFNAIGRWRFGFEGLCGL
jgi:hypothetical protein